MAKKLNIPDEFHDSLQQLLRLLPYKLQSDIDTQNTILVYLKLGGQKMARHGVEILKMRFLEELQNYADELSSPDAIDSEVEAEGDPDAEDTDYSDSDYLDDDDSDFEFQDRFNEDDEIVTETMANIYIEQENFEEAISTLEKLAENQPEQAEYFRLRIDEIKNNQNL